jgi:hypothetical protein
VLLLSSATSTSLGSRRRMGALFLVEMHSGILVVDMHSTLVWVPETRSGFGLLLRPSDGGGSVEVIFEPEDHKRSYEFTTAEISVALIGEERYTSKQSREKVCVTEQSAMFWPALHHPTCDNRLGQNILRPTARYVRGCDRCIIHAWFDFVWIWEANFSQKM